MPFVEELITQRALPELLTLKSGRPVKNVADFERRRAEIKTILQENEYGYIPPKPDHMKVEIVREDESFCAGKAVLKELKMIFELNGKEFSFPAVSVIPTAEGKHPAFVHINFRPQIPDKLQPTEEIVDRGYAVFSFCYNDVSEDNNDFKSGIAKYLCKSRRAHYAPGKIAIWAWAAMRMMDYIQVLDNIDKDNVAVIGHSRLGKTALVVGAFDDRFNYVISNDSGCSGAAITRGKIGESLPVITGVFPFWFCPKYREIACENYPYTFDQHFLLALTVPRHLIVGSAEEDLWADPTSEFLGVAAVNDVYKLYGMTGLVHNDEIPTPGCALGAGDSAYHIRRGKHYLSREDWNTYMDYIDRFVK